MRYLRMGRLTILCFMTSTAAIAAEPVEITARGGIAYDTNVFRLPDRSIVDVEEGQARSDFILNAEARLHLRPTLGLQEFLIDAAVARYQFLRLDDLSYTGVDSTGEWNWHVGSRLSGDAGLTFERRLTSFAYVRGQERNLEDLFSPYFRIRYVPGLQAFLYGGYSQIRFSNSSSALKVTDHKVKSIDGGVGYRFPNEAEIRLGVARTNNDYDINRAVPAEPILRLRNDFRQDDIEGTIEWPVGPRTKLSGRLAYTERDVRDFSEHDYSGLTGFLAVEYAISELTRFYISARRELAGVDDVLATVVKSDSAKAWIEYKPTIYLTVRADGEITRNDFRGFSDPVVDGGFDRNEKIGLLSLTADYRWSDYERLELAFRREIRRAAEEVLDYEANIISASLIIVR